MSDKSVDARSGEGVPLRRELSVWEAIAISLAVMAPSMAANINPQGAVATVGRAVPLAFALTTIGVLLVRTPSYGCASGFTTLAVSMASSGRLWVVVLGSSPGGRC
jgi:hypothetical protein